MKQTLKLSKKISSYIGVLHKFVLKFAKSLKQNVRAMEYWLQALECQNQSRNTKLLYWESNANLEILQKLSPSIEVSDRFDFKSVKCQVLPTNTIPFFWKIEANLEHPEKLSPYIGIYYNFVLKSVKSLNRIFWIMEHWFKALECKFDSW